MEKITAGILIVAAFTLANGFYMEHRFKQIEKELAKVAVPMSDKTYGTWTFTDAAPGQPYETWGSTGPATATGKGSVANSGHSCSMSLDENNKMNGWTDLKICGPKGNNLCIPGGSYVNADPGATMTVEEFLNLLQEAHGKIK